MNFKQIIADLPIGVAEILLQRLDEFDVDSATAHSVKKLVCSIEDEFSYLPQAEKETVFKLMAVLPTAIMTEITAE